MDDIYRLTLDEHSAGVTVARLEGEIDMETAPVIGARLERAVDQGPMVLDMERVEFIDSAGVRMLVEMGRHAEAVRGSLHIVAPEGSVVRRMIELTGIGRLFVITDNVSLLR